MPLGDARVEDQAFESKQVGEQNEMIRYIHPEMMLVDDFLLNQRLALEALWPSWLLIGFSSVVGNGSDWDWRCWRAQRAEEVGAAV